jgi:hypothetical protein
LKFDFINQEIIMFEKNNYSYELHPDMLQKIGEEFDTALITDQVAEAVKGKTGKEAAQTAEALFAEYGKNWIRLAHKLGDEYPDRTYEVLLESVDNLNGYYKFALVPQRFLEIAYLSTQTISILPIIENSANQLVYRMVECSVYNGLKEKAGEDLAKELPCASACLTACETLHADLEIDALVEMEAKLPADGYCQFKARRA